MASTLALSVNVPKQTLEKVFVIVSGDKFLFTRAKRVKSSKLNVGNLRIEFVHGHEQVKVARSKPLVDVHPHKAVGLADIFCCTDSKVRVVGHEVKDAHWEFDEGEMPF